MYIHMSTLKLILCPPSAAIGEGIMVVIQFELIFLEDRKRQSENDIQDLLHNIEVSVSRHFNGYLLLDLFVNFACTQAHTYVHTNTSLYQHFSHLTFNLSNVFLFAFGFSQML